MQHYEWMNGTAPEPYDRFLASIGTCAEVYVVYSKLKTWSSGPVEDPAVGGQI